MTAPLSGTFAVIANSGAATVLTATLAEAEAPESLVEGVGAGDAPSISAPIGTISAIATSLLRAREQRPRRGRFTEHP